MRIKFLLISAFIALLAYALSSKAEDIDLYSGLSGASGIPNVLIIIDNAASFSADTSGTCTYADDASTPNMQGKVAGIEQCSLYNVIHSLPVKADGSAVVNIGIMFYSTTGIAAAYPASGCIASNNGGCLFQKLIPMTAANKTSLKALIKGWHIDDIKANNQGNAMAMQEAWAYYSGRHGVSGRDYTQQLEVQGCQQNFVIYLGNAYSNNTTPGDNGSPSTELTTAGATSDQLDHIAITYAQGAACNTSSPFYTMPNHTDVSGLYADEWARFMRGTDINGTLTGGQNITTYTIGALGSACKADYPALLKSMASSGGGKYFATNADVADEIVQAFLKILNEVQAVNSVFASSSLPVSVNTQGTFLNQIFIGMFRPDAQGNPRWLGNLKQYQFVLDPLTQSLSLGDSFGDSAISSANTGFISPNAISFWTCDANSTIIPATKRRSCSPFENSTAGFWVNQPQSAGGAYDLPDGELVEKGGAAQMLRLANLRNDYSTSSTTDLRKLYTHCPDGSVCGVDQLSASTNLFKPANLTDALLGTGSRTITSITSAVTVNSKAVGTVTSNGGSGVVTITALSKSGSTVTATVSAADLATLAIGTQLIINTTGAKFNCNPCTVASLTPATNQFTYTRSGGGGSATLPYVAAVLTNIVDVTDASHTMSVGQRVTFSSCDVNITGLSGNVGLVTAITTGASFRVALSVSVSGSGTCSYTPNTATVTSIGHGFPTGDQITISSANPAGYNGTWLITVTGTNTFTYQYTSPAPLASSTVGTATSNTTKANLVNWVRGYDYKDEESGPGNGVTVRPSIHGDVLHSRPVVINYGGSTGVIAYYGSNDGVFHAVNGNQTGTGAGTELWGFIPSEFFGKLKRLHDNSPGLLLPSTPGGIIPTPQTKDYFADGSTGVYQEVDATGATTTANIYLTMRRGGRFIYGLNVGVPTDPQFKWKISNADLGFTEMGQTWSRPKTAKLVGYPNAVLIFGAGYDTAEDSEPPGTDTQGRGIFIIDADTGALVWSATHQSSGTTACSGTTTQASCLVSGMDYSIPSDITMVDHNGDGKIDRLYAADTGGNIWRVDLQPAGGSAALNNTPDSWRINKLAALGCTTGVCASGTTPRKFFFPPDVVPASGYDAVIVGSGDREHPLITNAALSITNRMYVLSDVNTSFSTSPSTTLITEANLFDATSASYPGGSAYKGFYITLAAGEKVVNAPATIAGQTFFGTNQPRTPSANSCDTNLGNARGYRISPFTGNGQFNTFDGGGLPPTPVYGLVEIIKKDANGNDVVDNQGHTVKVQVPFCIGCGGNGAVTAGAGMGDDKGGNTGICATDPTAAGCAQDPNNSGAQCPGVSALEACKAIINASSDRHRTYWYIERDE